MTTRRRRPGVNATFADMSGRLETVLATAAVVLAMPAASAWARSIIPNPGDTDLGTAGGIT